MDDMWKEADTIHKIWHKFCKHMSRWYYREEQEFHYVDNEIVYTGKTYKEFDSTKLVGYDAMTRVEKYVKNHPEIKIVHVDDSVYAGSYLVLVPHPILGITMMFIPQCTTTANEWFLYPGALESLQETLVAMMQEYNGFMSDAEIRYREQHKETK